MHCEPSRWRREKGPLNVEAFNGPNMSEGGLTAPATAQGQQHRDATNESGSGGLAFRCLIGVLLGFEDNAFVEFGEGKFDPDLGEGENGVGDQGFRVSTSRRSGRRP